MTKIKGKLQILPEVQNHDYRTKGRAKGFIEFKEMADKAPIWIPLPAKWRITTSQSFPKHIIL
jgi:hypothetical protein